MTILSDTSASRTPCALSQLRYPGCSVTSCRRDGNGGIHVYLDSVGDAVCPNCGRICSKYHERRDRIVRDAPLLANEPVYVHFKARRVRCSCGCHKTEALSWVSPRARLTNLLVASIQSLLRFRISVRDVACYFRLAWDTVRVCDQLLLDHFYSHVDFAGVEDLAIDEFALHKGHRYATVVMDLKSRRVLWVGQGKSRRAIEPFFELLRQHKATGQIKSVSCDMNAAYPRMVRENLPGAEIVYDLFHVMANFVKDVLVEAKRVSRDRLLKKLNQSRKKKTEDSGPDRSRIRSQLNELNNSEWLLVRRPDDLEVDKQQLLKRLKDDNELLSDLAPMAGILRGLWGCPDPDKARENLEGLRRLLEAAAEKHDFRPAARFARMLRRRADGIVTAGRHRLGTGPLEGANNKIKVLKRTGYGYRNFDYFALKIKSILPGKNGFLLNRLTDYFAVLKTGLWTPAFPLKP